MTCKQVLSLTLTILLALPSASFFGQSHPDSLQHIEVAGNDTDPLINFDGSKKHQVFYNPTAVSNNTLLVHLVGSYDNPNSSLLFPTEAANSGFHAINLMYRNLTAAQTACGDQVDPDCYLNFRKEIIEGVDYSTQVNVNAANSILNRLLKLLEYLETNYPDQNWSQYRSGTTLFWDKIMISGHSQGGGHAAVIGITEPLKRIIMFASPNDYIDTLSTLAPWSSQAHVAEDSVYYGLNAYYDDVVDFWMQSEQWIALGMDSFGDTVNIDNTTSPYNGSHQLYTQQIVPPGGLADITHSVMISDNQTPKDSLGDPLFRCAWRYLLGLECGTSLGIESAQRARLSVYPNPCAEYITVINHSNHPSSIVLMDVLGKTRYSLLFTAQATQLDLSSLESGIYFLLLLEEDKVISSTKIIKQ